MEPVLALAVFIAALLWICQADQYQYPPPAFSVWVVKPDSQLSLPVDILKATQPGDSNATVNEYQFEYETE